MSSTPLYKRGENVQARLPGANSYKNAKILSMEIKGSYDSDQYRLLFEDGTQLFVSGINIRKPRSVRKSPARNIPVAITPSSPTRKKSPARDSTSRIAKSTRNKSPARDSSPSRARSTRNKSPGRDSSPSRGNSTRNKSPSRAKTTRNISPVRRPKSPSRALEKASKVSSIKVKSTENKNKRTISPVIDLSSDSDLDDKDLAQRTKKNFEKVTKSRDFNNKLTGTGYLTRRSLRATIPQISNRENAIYSDSYVKINRLNEFSDGENEKLFEAIKEKQLRASRQRSVRASVEKIVDAISSGLEKGVEFGGTFGVLLLILFSLSFPIYLQLWCNKSHCTFSKYPDIKNSTLDWRKHIVNRNNLLKLFNASKIYFAFLFLQLFFIIVHFGGKKLESPYLSRTGKWNYYQNGWLACVCAIVLTISFDYLKYTNCINDIYKLNFELSIVPVMFAIVLSIVLYVKSKYIPVANLNAYADTSSKVYNFFMGREVNPKVYRVDIKQWIIRNSITLNIILNLTYIIKSLKVNSMNELIDLNLREVNMNYTLITCALMQIIYSADYFIFESNFLTTFEFQKEGFGLMSAIGYAIWPTYFAIIPKYLLEHNVQLPWWHLMLNVVLFLAGYILYRLSNYQKDEYRKNPFKSKYETISSSKGSVLLVGGFWGFVRHPNYLGDIILHLGISLFCPFVPATLVAFPLVLAFLIYRSKRDHYRCQSKYKSSWDVYCQRVKYAIIPYVY